MKTLLILFVVFLNLLYANEIKTVNAVLGLDKPPFIFGKTTQKGIEPDLLREAFANVGYKVNITQKQKAFMQTVLDTKNQYDMVATISKNDKKNYFYSDTFTTYENYVITRKADHIVINSIDDLQSIQFVAWEGAYNDLGKQFYKLFNPINGTSKNNYHDNMSQKDDVKMFFSKKVDAIVIDKTIFNWFKIHFNNHDKYEFHKIFPKIKTYPVTFRDKKLRDKFNIGLKKLKQSGRYDEIIKFYATQNVEELITFTALIADISSQYMYKNNIKQLKQILKRFFQHPDIVVIVLKDTNGKIIFKLIRKNNKIIEDHNFKCLKLPTLVHKIYYSNNNEIIPLGEVHIHYKKDFKTNNGVLIPPLKLFKNNPNYKNIKVQYKKLHLIDKNQIHLTAKEKQYLEHKKFITVHNESLWAPYNFNENGIPKGFVIDYIDLLASKLHIDIKYISGYSWSEYIKQIKAEKIDVIANIAKTKERSKYINFTKTFIQARKAIFSNTANYKTLSELEGKTVAVPKNFFIDGYLQSHYPKIKLKRYKNVLECIYAVINKEADAMVETYAVVNYLLKQEGLSFKYVNISNNKELITNLKIGVRKSQVILRDILQKAIDNVSAEEFAKLKNKWFGIDKKTMPLFTTKEQSYMKKKKFLRVCTNPNWAPIEFVQNGQPKGITIDILKSMSKNLNMKLKFISTTSWKESQQFLKDRKCDILASAIKTKEREEYANFTKPYVTYNLAIVTKYDKPLVRHISQIVDKPMARKEASGISMILKEKYPKLQIQNTKNVTEAFKEVNSGRVYFTVATLPVYAYNKKINDFSNLQVAGYCKIKASLSIAVRNDDQILFDILSKVLMLVPSDTIEIINNKWTTQEVIKQTDYTMVIMILLLASIIVIVISRLYLKQKHLKEEINALNLSLQDKVKEEIIKNQEKEKLMLQQSRLAQMGEIISMIAHQWRQPLNTISILNQSVVLKFNMKKLDKEYIQYFQDSSKKQIKHMSETIDDFRNFFKPEKEKINFCINAVVNNTLNMIKPVLTKENINITFEATKDIYIVGYANELGQAVLNIINNAKDALIENKIEKKQIKMTLSKKGSKSILTIEDNAGGIPNNIMDKIFQPYFSTKNEKNGTGLGLYMTKIIIEEHLEGKLEVSNNKDGAVFKIIL